MGADDGGGAGRRCDPGDQDGGSKIQGFDGFGDDGEAAVEGNAEVVVTGEIRGERVGGLQWFEGPDPIRADLDEQDDVGIGLLEMAENSRVVSVVGEDVVGDHLEGAVRGGGRGRGREVVVGGLDEAGSGEDDGGNEEFPAPDGCEDDGDRQEAEGILDLEMGEEVAQPEDALGMRWDDITNISDDDSKQTGNVNRIKRHGRACGNR